MTKIALLFPFPILSFVCFAQTSDDAFKKPLKEVIAPFPRLVSHQPESCQACCHFGWLEYRNRINVREHNRQNIAPIAPIN